MIHRKFIASIAAGAALLTLGACGSSIDGEAQPVPTPEPAAAPSQPAPEPPPLPLPNTDTGGVIEEVYLETIAEEGIVLDEQTALEAADIACDTPGLFDAIDAVQAATGLTHNDAAYLVGAALFLCGVR